MVNYSTYRGGLAYGVPLKIKNYSKTRGSGMQNINRIGGADQESIIEKEILEIPSKPRGRPPKTIIKQEEKEDVEEDQAQPKCRNRDSCKREEPNYLIGPSISSDGCNYAKE
jgi:hypothetical protein